MNFAINYPGKGKRPPARTKSMLLANHQFVNIHISNLGQSFMIFSGEKKTGQKSEE